MLYGVRELDHPSNLVFKIIVVGDVGVGKTSLVRRFTQDTYCNNYKPTIGVDFWITNIAWDDKSSVQLQFWDIGGQERFGCMTRVFYKEAIAAIVVFDISRNQTLESAKTWKKDIDDKVTLPNGELIPTFLLCNKCDLEREVQSEKLTKFCYDNGFIGWFATSAKDGIGIEDSKMNLVQLIMTIPYEVQVPEDTIVIDEEKSRFSLRPSCC